MVKEVRQPCLGIDSGKFAAAHHRVHHGGILGRIVVLAEEVVLARQRNWTLLVLNKIGVYPVSAVDDIAAQAVVVGNRIVDGHAFIIVAHGIAVHSKMVHHLYLPVERKAVNIFAYHQVARTVEPA